MHQLRRWKLLRRRHLVMHHLPHRHVLPQRFSIVHYLHQWVICSRWLWILRSLWRRQFLICGCRCLLDLLGGLSVCSGLRIMHHMHVWLICGSTVRVLCALCSWRVFDWWSGQLPDVCGGIVCGG